jgi:tetratricopeptide (TPR) repeat protein
VNLLSRATALLPPEPHLYGELLCELGIALFSAGALEEADDVLQRAAALAVAAGDRRLELRSRLELAYRRLEGDPEATVDELLGLADQAVPVFEALGDDRALGRTWLLVGYVQGGLRCLSSVQEEALGRALGHYARSGWPTSTCIGELAASLYFGATPVPDAIARCESLLLEAGAAPSAEANILVYLGGLRAMLGEFSWARELLERAQQLYAELGLALVAVTNGAAVSADIELLCADHGAAEQRFRQLYQASEEMHDRAHAATWAAQLAEAVYAQGRYDEAERWSVVAEELALRDDVGVQAAWRCVRAKILARRAAAEADVLGRAAAALAEGMETLNQQAKAYLDLGEVRLLEGRVEEATAFVTKAADLYERKGNLVSAARARSLLNEPLPT